jgi:DNA-binding XRE family transcriptional regulator
MSGSLACDGDAPCLITGEQTAVKPVAKTADFRAVTKRKTPTPKHPPGIAILRDATGRLALFINGQRSDRGGQGQLGMLACLLDNLGRAVPYKRLVAVIGRKSDNSSTRHLLRQYMSMLRVMLLANKAPFVIATIHEVGYALCEIAENPRHTSRIRRSNGVSRLGKNVRHWRIAAGLTQTAVAKRSGMNRFYLSRLESGHRNPTLATLERLAKTLKVTPGAFFEGRREAGEERISATRNKIPTR